MRTCFSKWRSTFGTLSAHTHNHSPIVSHNDDGMGGIELNAVGMNFLLRHDLLRTDRLLTTRVEVKDENLEGRTRLEFLCPTAILEKANTILYLRYIPSLPQSRTRRRLTSMAPNRRPEWELRFQKHTSETCTCLGRLCLIPFDQVTWTYGSRRSQTLIVQSSEQETKTSKW
jgi:hypothetical protein